MAKSNKLSRTSVISSLLAILLVYISFGATFYHYVEHWNWLNSFYFVVITLSTVGYGDFSPHTDAGKLFTMPYVFIGIGLFIAVANAILRSRGQKALEKREERHNGKAN